jgi:hypothetical protein
MFPRETQSTSITCEELRETQELLYFRSALAGVFRLWCVPLERHVAPRLVMPLPSSLLQLVVGC